MLKVLCDVPLHSFKPFSSRLSRATVKTANGLLFPTSKCSLFRFSDLSILDKDRYFMYV